jgi:hypothetical protein
MINVARLFSGKAERVPRGNGTKLCWTENLLSIILPMQHDAIAGTFGSAVHHESDQYYLSNQLLRDKLYLAPAWPTRVVGYTVGSYQIERLYYAWIEILKGHKLTALSETPSS